MITGGVLAKTKGGGPGVPGGGKNSKILMG